MLQHEALDILKMGKNVFLTGPAGSGKTFVLNSYIQYLKSHGVDVAVTASTGIAATHLGGQTIHSWSGLGVKGLLTDYDIENMMEKAYLYKRFQRTKVLIIDEISMILPNTLDMVDWICREMKKNHAPFGGMQVIVCGDFFQLPPIFKNEVPPGVPRFAYESESWKNAKLTVCYISEQHRQKDGVYLGILNQIRNNSVSGKTVELLNGRYKKDIEHLGEFTRLYTHNEDVDTVNNRHLSLIPGEPKVFRMSWKGSQVIAQSLIKSCLSPETLELKVGAKVMFTKNKLDGGYVNGTMGKVLEFNSFGDPVIETTSGMRFPVSTESWKIEEEGKIKAEIIQLPLRLAWAITVHKSQGMSLDSMEVDLSKAFERGMGYVALSRVRSLEGIRLLGLNETSLLIDENVLEMDKKFKEKSNDSALTLEAMSKKEIEEIQEEFLRTIEPEEKILIKRKAKSNLKNLIARSSEAGFREKGLNKSTHDITRDMLAGEIPLDEIAKKRGVKQETIVSHIEDLIAENNCPDITYLKRELKRTEFEDILDAFEKVGTTTLSPVFNLLSRQKKKPTYLKLRLARLFLNS